MISVKNLPKTPGVYLFKSKDAKVLYVGKAVNLKNRVSSYLKNKESLSPKTRALIEKSNTVDHIKVDNELEALLLEAELIKKYNPPYNITLKDDKFYKYIKIFKDNTLSYKITTSRKKKDVKAKYFGPYPESSSVDLILKTLRRVFPYRDCSNSKFTRYKKIRRPCLYGDIGICPAPCQGLLERNINNKNIKRITDYLSGNKQRFFVKLRKEMINASKKQQYEAASIIRDQLASYEYISRPKRNIKEYLRNPNLYSDIKKESLRKLVDILKVEGGIKFRKQNLKNFRSEAYDISNIQGKNATGSMVVFIEGIPVNSEYRRFRIKTKDTPDDFSMMQEVLRRRFSKTKKSNWPKPHLIIIDGGKGQLTSALELLKDYKLNIPCIGLAKKFEEIFIKNGDKYTKIILPKDSPSLKLLQEMRNEAHRFAINYYRKLHRKNLLQ